MEDLPLGRHSARQSFRRSPGHANGRDRPRQAALSRQARNPPILHALDAGAARKWPLPGIDDRTYPASLAGPQYPEGIPIVEESAMESLIREHGIDDGVFSYSDV